MQQTNSPKHDYKALLTSWSLLPVVKLWELLLWLTFLFFFVCKQEFMLELRESEMVKLWWWSIGGGWLTLSKLSWLGVGGFFFNLWMAEVDSFSYPESTKESSVCDRVPPPDLEFFSVYVPLCSLCSLFLCTKVRPLPQIEDKSEWTWTLMVRAADTFSFSLIFFLFSFFFRFSSFFSFFFHVFSFFFSFFLFSFFHFFFFFSFFHF